MRNDSRVLVTKRMLREGMLRCLEEKPLSGITVSDLARESGINRATFYRHYDSPPMILREIAREYADHLFAAYRAHAHAPGADGTVDEKGLEACLDYLYAQRDDIRVLFSKNAENCLAGFGQEIIIEEMKKREPSDPGQETDAFLAAVTSASAMFGLIQTWIMMDIHRTPKELVRVLKPAVRGSLFL